MKISGFIFSLILIVMISGGCENSKKNAPNGKNTPTEKIRLMELVDSSLGSPLSFNEIPKNNYLFKSIRRTMWTANQSNSFEHISQASGWVNEEDPVTRQNHSGEVSLNFSTGFPLEINSTETEVQFVDGRSYKGWYYDDSNWGWELGARGVTSSCNFLGEVLNNSKINDSNIFISTHSIFCGYQDYRTVFQMSEGRLYITLHHVESNPAFGQSLTRFEFIQGQPAENSPKTDVFKK